MDAENDELLFCRFCLRQSQSSFPIFMDADPGLAMDVMRCLQIRVRIFSILLDVGTGIRMHALYREERDRVETANLTMEYRLLYSIR